MAEKKKSSSSKSTVDADLEAFALVVQYRTTQEVDGETQKVKKRKVVKIDPELTLDGVEVYARDVCEQYKK